MHSVWFSCFALSRAVRPVYKARQRKCARGEGWVRAGGVGWSAVEQEQAWRGVEMCGVLAWWAARLSLDTPRHALLGRVWYRTSSLAVRLAPPATVSRTQSGLPL